MLEEFNYNKQEHRQLFLEILNDPEICRYLGKSQIIDLVNTQIIEKHVLIVNNISVGIGFIQPLRKGEAEIRYCIRKDQRGNGYSNLIVKGLLDKIGPGINVYADIQPENYASAKSALNNGFSTDDDFIYKIKR